MINRINAIVVFVLLGVGAWPGLADHPRDVARVLPACLQGNFGPARKAFLKEAEASGRNRLLYLYELGGLYNLKGEFAQSLAFLNQADRVAHEYEGKALASVTGGLAQTGASLSNDTVLPWEGACFEKVMSRTLNALNYLAAKDLEGARVEVRKAEEYQSLERERKQPQLDPAQARAAANTLGSSNVASAYNEMNAFVQNVRNSHENAFTYYLASHIYRAQGVDGLNDALVDIQQAYALAPDVPAVQLAYLDLLARGQGAEDPALLRELRVKLGLDPGWLPSDFDRVGTVVVIYQPGFAPRLSEVNIDLYLPSADRFSMAFPIYRDFSGKPPPLLVQAGAVRRSTQKLVDIRQLAVISLKERLPAILARGALGALAKVQAQKQAEKEYGILGKLVTGLVTRSVTAADLRSWLSLPAEVQAAQLVLAPGPQPLTLSGEGWTETTTVQVRPGATTFVTVRAVPGGRAITATTLPATILPATTIPAGGAVAEPADPLTHSKTGA